MKEGWKLIFGILFFSLIIFIWGSVVKEKEAKEMRWQQELARQERVEECIEDVKEKYGRVLLDSCGMSGVSTDNKEAMKRCVDTIDRETQDFIAKVMEGENRDCMSLY